jgi:hypothetical protein
MGESQRIIVVMQKESQTQFVHRIGLEKDILFLTKRPSRYRNVLFHRSTCAVKPLSLPAAVCYLAGMTKE